MHRYITLVNYTVRIAVLVKQEDFRFEDFIECHIHHFQYFFAQNRLKNFSSNMHICEGICNAYWGFATSEIDTFQC